MSKIVKFFAIAALVGGAFAMTPAPAAAYHGHGGWHGGGGHWHGGWGGPGVVFGFGPAWGWGGYPYSYYGDYAGPPCGWAHVRVWRHGHWALRRAWRCW